MDKRYDHEKHEEKIYSLWEKGGYFTPNQSLRSGTGQAPKKKPFTIIMPPPNANAPLHMGHATFVAVSDTLIRYHRMKGEPTLWLPGVDHAGILTQAVFERTLAKKGKTRYDLGRKRFFKQVYKFCMKNKSTMENQLRLLGASCDWTREKFTLDPEISNTVKETFIKLYKEGLIYRGHRIVNWCPHCRTTLSNLETEDKEKKAKLYYLNYGPVTIATTRPETIFADTAVAVNPSDKRYKKLIGNKAIVPLIDKEIPIIADKAVDPEFGTGAVKITPDHDPLDYEIGQRHKLKTIKVIDFDGKITSPAPKKYTGIPTQQAQRAVVKDLKTGGFVKKVKKHKHTVKTCERCKTEIEPLNSHQWFIKIKPLAKPAIEAVRKSKTKITPKRFEKMYFHWMNNIQDWPISRQIWWGHQLPVYYCQGCQKTREAKKQFKLLKTADPRAQTELLQKPLVSQKTPKSCPNCKSKDILQDPDTLDTWFSSGQWPFTTLGYPSSKDFKYFYPTTVMNTAYEILFLWVARMLMFGLYRTGKIPFHTTLINGVLRDEKGRKMSKSAGNATDPIDMAKLYSADAVRAGLIYGRDTGTDLAVSKKQLEARIKSQRNFANKVWNIARFALSYKLQATNYKLQATHPDDKWILNKLKKSINKTTQLLENYKTGQALEVVYEFIWHKLADVYIEKVKNRRKEAQPTLIYTLQESLKLLHPFMPFLTEAIWQTARKQTGNNNYFKEKILITAKWATS